MKHVWVLIALLVGLSADAQASRWYFLPTAPPNAFIATGTGGNAGFCAQAEDFEQYVPMWSVITDVTASGAERLRSMKDYGAQLAVNTNFTTGTYYGWAVGRCTNGNQCAVWVSQTPFGPVPSNTMASLFPALSVETILPLGTRADENLLRQSISEDITQRTFAITNGAPLYIHAQNGVELDYLFFATSATAAPSCGAPPQEVVNYEAYKFVTEPTVDGTEEGMWNGANNVIFLGADSGITAQPSLKFMWKPGTPNRLCGLYKVTLANMEATTTANDTSTITNDTGFRWTYRTINLNRVQDADWLQLILNGANPPAIFDSNYPGGVFSNAYTTPNLTRARTYAGNILRIEWCQDIANVSANSLGLFNARAQERVTAGTVKTKQAFGSGNVLTPADAGVMKFLDVNVPVTPDVTPPTMGAPTFSNVTATGFTASSTATDTESGVIECQGQYDTDNDNAVSGADVSAILNCGLPQAGSCVCNIPGLTGGQAYEVVIKGTNGAQLVGTSAVGDQTTIAPAAGVYISPTGSDTTGAGTIGNPWKTLIFACAPARLVAGGTIIMRDGNYPPQGILNSTLCRNGSLQQPITIKAENERKAKIVGDATATQNLQIDSLNYYTVEGLHVNNERFTNGRAHTTYIRNSTNITFKRNLLDGSNRIKNGHMIWISSSDFVLVEENEIYRFHRHGIQFYNSNNGVARRNYLMGQTTPPGAGDDFGHAPYDISDEGISAYPGNNNTFENNMFHRTEIAGSPNAQTGCGSTSKNTIVVGNVGYIMQHAWWTGARPGTSVNCTPHDTTFEHNVAVDSVGNGALFETPKGVVSRNNTVYNSAGNGFYTKISANEVSDGIYDVLSENDLAFSSGSTGFNFTVPSGLLAFTATKPGAFANGTNFNPAASPNFVNPVVVDPGFGTTRVCVPNTSPMYGAGVGGGHIGASVLYAYKNGLLQDGTGGKPLVKLWSPTKPHASLPTNTSGRYFLGCGAIVAGINDNAANACYSFTDRVGVTTASLNSCVNGTY